MSQRACGARYHGTATAYDHHGCRCPSARAAHTRYRNRLAAGIQPPGLVDATGTRRRIQAMQAMGHEQATIAARLGTGKDAVNKLLGRRQVHPRTARAVAAACRELGMTPGRSRRARDHARSRGWVTLLAWDDIDDPRERPSLGGSSRDDAEPDHAAIAAAVQATPPPVLRPVDRRAAAAVLARRGHSHPHVADVLRVSPQTVLRDLSATRPAGAVVA